MAIPPNIVGILAFLLLFILIIFNMPIAFAFVSVGFLGLWYLFGLQSALVNLSLNVWEITSNYILLTLPLFMLMGQFANHSGIGPDLYNTALKWWGKLPGGLALTTVWGCAAFSAVTGSSTAGVLTFTPIAYQPMLDLKYDKRVASGSITAGATMGVLIPPSTAFILYGVMTNVSLGRLFIAGIMPGILEAVLYSITILLITGLNLQSGPAGPGSSWKDKFLSLRKTWGMLAIFLLVIGGIYLGVFTPTEAAAIGAAGTFVILLFRNGFNSRLIALSIKGALQTSGMILLIILCALIFSDVLVVSGLSKWAVDIITAAGVHPYIALTFAIILMFGFGCVMPATPMILLFTPLLYPIFVVSLGFDAIWFGVIMVVMVELGLITPPIGMNLFAFKSLAGEETSMSDIYYGVIPYLLADIFRLVLLIAFPIISLWLPSRMF